MLKIILPYIYNNTFYNKLFNFSNKNKLYKNMKIYNTYGNFPWSYWHGGKSSNINIKEVILEKQVENIKNNFRVPIFIDLSNTNLILQDLKDRKLNMILNEINNGGNKIICSDLSIAEELKKIFPYYDLIFSDNAALQLPFTEDIINTIIEQDFFYSIIVNPDFTDKNFDYNKIIDKNKIIIRIGRVCAGCKSYMKCVAQEHFNQYNFSENSIFEQCNKCKKISDIAKTLKDEIDYYHNLGFTNFILDEPIKSNMTLDKYNINLLYALKNEEDNDIIKEVLLDD